MAGWCGRNCCRYGCPAVLREPETLALEGIGWQGNPAERSPCGETVPIQINTLGIKPGNSGQQLGPFPASTALGDGSDTPIGLDVIGFRQREQLWLWTNFEEQFCAGKVCSG